MANSSLCPKRHSELYPWWCYFHLGPRASCAKDFPNGSSSLHWTLTTDIMTSFPNENALWGHYFNVIFPAIVSQILANVVFTPWLVFLLLTAALPSQSSALRCSATCNCSKQHFCVRKPQLPSKLCPRQLPLSFLHLNVDRARETHGSRLTFGIKTLWQPVLPKNNIHPFPMSADKQAAFLRPGLAGYSQGLEEKLQDVWPSSKCKGFFWDLIY